MRKRGHHKDPGDSLEDIRKCLSCPYDKCYNCLGGGSTYKGQKKLVEATMSRAEMREKLDPVAMELYKKGYPDIRIAKEAGCSINYVKLFRGRYGLPSNKRPHHNPTTAKMFELFDQGYSMVEVASKVNKTLNAVYSAHYQWNKERRMNGSP